MIKIIDGYGFEQDRNGFTLFEVGKRQKGVFGKLNEKSDELIDFKTEIGYYSTIQGRSGKLSQTRYSQGC